MVVSKEEKSKKKRAAKQFITDYSDFLPESLIYISKTNITSKVRIGERYQAEVPLAPPLASSQRPVEEWKVWSGCSNPQERPSEEHINRFKEILGGNRT